MQNCFRNALSILYSFVQHFRQSNQELPSYILTLSPGKAPRPAMGRLNSPPAILPVVIQVAPCSCPFPHPVIPS